MLRQYFKFLKRDIKLNLCYRAEFSQEKIEQIKLFQEDILIIATENKLMIYNISEKKLLVEQKMNLKREYSDAIIIKIYGKNKFLIFHREKNDILFFELILTKKTNQYLLKQLGLIPIPHYQTQILIKDQQLILDAFDISKKKLEEFDNKKNIRINTLKVYDLNNFEFILNIDIPFLKDEDDDVFSIHINKPLVFTLNDKTLGFFESENIYNNNLITYTTFKKSYALNEKKILNFHHIPLYDLKFMEVKYANQKYNKFILYPKSLEGFREFFLFSSKDFTLINVIKCPDILSRIDINEKGKVFGFTYYKSDRFYEIELEKNFILNNSIKYKLNDDSTIKKLIALEKPQKLLFIIYDDFTCIPNFLPFYLTKSSKDYIIEDITNFIICFLYISFFYREIYEGENFSIKYFGIPILLKLKLKWSFLHFILLNIQIILAIFLKFSVAKGIGLLFLIGLFYLVLFLCSANKNFHWKI